MIEKVKEKTECIIDEILEQGITVDNVDMLGQLVDIHKDVANEEYWECKEESIDMYRYGNYNSGNYNARGRGGRGNYSTQSYNTGRYRGHDMIDDIGESYGAYMDDKSSGRYGGQETIKSLEYMLESVVNFIEMLKREASSQEEMELIREYSRRISEM